MRLSLLLVLLAVAEVQGPRTGRPVRAPRERRPPSASALGSAPAAAAVTMPCQGTSVQAGADLAAIVDAGAPNETFCISAGTYDLGTSSVRPKSGMRLVGAPVERGPLGEIRAPTRIVSRGTRGVIFFPEQAHDVVLENLDISGAVGVKDETDPQTKQHGRGVNGNQGAAVRLTVRQCAIHDNMNTGIGGAGAGLHVVRCELFDNGSASYLGCCAGGVKSAGPLTVEDSYVHDNTGMGIWQDVCGTDFVVERNRVTGNSQGGIRYEHGRDCPGSARIHRNVVQGNNTSGGKTHAGIEINSAPGADVAFNELGGNGRAGIRIGGARGPLTGTSVHDNVLNGDLVWGCDREGVTCDGGLR